MGYTQRLSGGIVPTTTVATLTALSLTAAATTYGRWICTRSLMVKQLLFYVSAGVTTGTVAIINIKKHLAVGVSAGQVTVGSLSVPNSATVGQVIYKNLTPTQFNAGDEICIDVQRAGTDGGTAAGAGFVDFVFDLEPEDPANITDMTASA